MATNMTRKKKIIVSVFVFVLALFPRLFEIHKTPIFGDEVTWTVWGKELVYSVIKGNLNSYSQHAWYNDQKEGHDIGLPLNWFIGAGNIILTDESKFGLGLVSPIIASRVINITIASLTPVAIFLIGGQLVTPIAAFMAAVLYSLTPTIIGVDRWVFQDSMQTLLTFIAIGLFIAYTQKRRFSVVPGLFLGLAFLTKPTGALPIIPWLVLVISQKERRFVIKMIIANTISSLGAVLIIWPESWRRPVISIFEYIWKIIHLPGDELLSFYFGKSSLDPGPTFYLFQFVARLPEVIIFLFTLAVVTSVRPLKKIGLSAIAVGISCLFYLAFLSFLPFKVGFRYLLPILPWIYLLIGNFINKQKTLNQYVIFTATLVLLVITDVHFHPDYIVYYNRLVGGPGNAVKYDTVPSCYASKSGLKYLNDNRIHGTIYIAGCSAGEPYYNSGRTFTKNYTEADIIILGTDVRQEDPSMLEKVLNGKHHIYEIIIKESPVGEIWLKN